MNKLHELGTANKCSGCTACFNICPKHSIDMVQSDDGFKYPSIDKTTCIECNSCTSICPWLLKDNNRDKYDQRYYSAKRIDCKKRLLSQSGGAFSVFAENVLKKKGIVYGVEYIDNEVKYCRITSMSELKRIRGSKYVQANLGGIFSIVEKDLKDGKIVLFSGTACHVDGLKRFLTYKDINLDGLYTIDIVCHGVVSPHIFAEYISYIEKKHNGRVKAFNFRNKSFGWHGHFVTYKISNTTYKSKDYVKIFYSSYALRKTCYECQYASLQRVGDLTLGDSWGIGDYYPDFDDNKGCSLIIENSKKGKQLLEESLDDFHIIEIKKEEAIQPNLKGPTEKPLDYETFWDDYQKYGFEYVIYKYCEFNSTGEQIILQKHQLFRRTIAKIRRVFGM